MRLNLPYYKQRRNSRFNCGPTSFRIAMEYFKIFKSKQQILKVIKQSRGGMTFGPSLLLAAYKVGLNAMYFSNRLERPDMRSAYFKIGMGKDGIKRWNALIKEIKDNNLKMHKKNLNLNQLLKFITPNSIPIVIINTKIIDKLPGYNGHLVALTGYDKNNIYYHDSGPRFAIPNFKANKKIFFKAWASKGSDRTVTIISKRG